MDSPTPEYIENIKMVFKEIWSSGVFHQVFSITIKI